MVRTTVLKPEDATEIRAKGLAPLTDSPGDEYRANIQIAELNALNARALRVRTGVHTMPL